MHSAVSDLQSSPYDIVLIIDVEEEPYALLNLTCLLTTGRASEGLMDFLGSAEHMSDRVCSIPLLGRTD